MFDLQGLNLYLIGMMGSGKSTVSKLLAERLAYRFIDTDMSIEKICDRSISEIFQTAGEAEFRQIETQVLADISAYTRLVVSTGGGIAMKLENWNHLQQGLVVWLDVSVDILVERLREDTSRPLIVNASANELHDKLSLILAERRDRYAAADLRISIASEISSSEIIDRIFEAIPTVLKPTAIAID
jgi:shikimate kinase